VQYSAVQWSDEVRIGPVGNKRNLFFQVSERIIGRRRGGGGGGGGQKESKKNR